MARTGSCARAQRSVRSCPGRASFGEPRRRASGRFPAAADCLQRTIRRSLARVTGTTLTRCLLTLPHIAQPGSGMHIFVGFVSSTDGERTWTKRDVLGDPMRLGWLGLRTDQKGRMVGDYVSTSVSKAGRSSFRHSRGERAVMTRSAQLSLATSWTPCGLWCRDNPARVNLRPTRGR